MDNALKILSPRPKSDGTRPTAFWRIEIAMDALNGVWALRNFSRRGSAPFWRGHSDFQRVELEFEALHGVSTRRKISERVVCNFGAIFQALGEQDAGQASSNQGSCLPNLVERAAPMP